MKTRLRAALKAASLHLLLSLLVAVLAGALVFGLWFPAPLHQIAGGAGLFLILMAVDVVCGPVLTLILFDPQKARRKWLQDVALIAIVQFGALVYGLSQMAAARPVFIALEGDRFRVVQAMDVDLTQLAKAPPELRTLGYTGPRVISARLSRPGDADYLESVQLSTQGLHPAFRPGRWQIYDGSSPGLLSQLQPLALLRDKNPDRTMLLDETLHRLGVDGASMGYLPLVREEITEWVVLVRLSDGTPVSYLPLDGW